MDADWGSNFEAESHLRTAERILRGQACRLPEKAPLDSGGAPLDSKGIPMEMVF